MKTVYRLLFGLHLFVGIGAMFGGAVAIITPDAPFGMTTESLANTPFNNYLIPGLILFGLLGLGNVFCAWMFRFKTQYQGYISSVFSWALVIWIVVQCIMLKVVAAPHVIYFLLGAIEAALSAALLFEKRLFPANVVLKILQRD